MLNKVAIEKNEYIYKNKEEERTYIRQFVG